MGCSSGNLSQFYNTTPTPREPFTGNKELYETAYRYIYGYGLPTVCACGFLGNVMNLIILAGRRIQYSLRSIERSANIGLIALAFSDMMFCICAFPSTFLPKDMVFQSISFLTYYQCYCAAVINIFIMTSTWITVVMATERYLAICHPLKSRKLIKLGRTRIAIFMTFVCSALFNIPVFWRYKIEEVPCKNETLYMTVHQVLYNSEKFDHSYRAAWAAFGNFIPLVLLLFFNVRLTQEIHKSYALRKQMNGNVGKCRQNDNEANNRVTLTLIAIVVMFFVLVAPSEILKQIALLTGADLSTNFTYQTIEITTNFMQTINFSANFILYCIINASFRKTMRELFCFHYRKLKMDSDNFSDMPMSLERMSSFRPSPRTTIVHASSTITKSNV